MDKSMEEVDKSFPHLCQVGDLEGVMDLIEKGLDINEKDDDERTPLHWASSSKNPELVRYLLSISGIQINIQDDAGYSPIMCATAAGKEENVKLLLEAGADVNLENENKETVLHMTRANTNIMKLFIDKIQDINKKNDYGMTALMKAASIGCMETVQLLLDHKADPNIRDHEGNTAAHYAAFDMHRETYLLLKANGCDITIKNKEGKEAIDYVAYLCLLTNTISSQ